MTAIYTTNINKSLSILIPKRRGTGFCKSVFGGHHSNENSRKFDEIKPKWFIGDTCDIDGYLEIGLTLNWWDDGYGEGVRLTLEALKEVFPFITDFEINDDEFWRNVIK